MFAQLIEKLHRREDLTEGEASAAMVEIMDGRATAAQIAGMLIALSMKGERPAEIVGFARTMRERSMPLASPVDDVFDTCGTGGDRLNTFNVSSLSALTVAACGARVAKHGNRSVSSACGSADLFEALGVDVSASPAVVERCLESAGIAFFFAPVFHPSMRHAGPARRELGVRTAFNLLGPLTNPAGGNTADCRCGPAGAHRSAGAGARLARIGSRLGRARSRRPGRDLHHRIHEGVGVPARRATDVLSASQRLWSGPSVHRCGACLRARRERRNRKEGPVRHAWRRARFRAGERRRESVPRGSR